MQSQDKLIKSPLSPVGGELRCLKVRCRDQSCTLGSVLRAIIHAAFHGVCIQQAVGEVSKIWKHQLSGRVSYLEEQKKRSNVTIRPLVFLLKCSKRPVLKLEWLNIFENVFLKINPN